MKRGLFYALGLSLVAILILVKPHLARSQSGPEENHADSQKRMSSDAIGYLRITCAPESHLGDAETIAVLVNSREVIARMMRDSERFDWTPDQFAEAFANDRIRFVAVPHSKTNTSLIRVMVFSIDDRLPAEDLLSLLIESLRSYIERLDEPVAQLTLLNNATGAASSLKKQIQQKRNEASHLRAALGPSGLDDETLEVVRRELIAQKLELELEVRALETRREMLAEKIAEITKHMQEAVKNDPIAAKLEMVVQLRRELLEVIQIEQSATQEEESKQQTETRRGEIAEAEIDLAQAETELAKWREEYIYRSIGGQLVELRQQLTAAEINLAESTERYKAIIEQISSPPSESVTVKAVDSEIEVLERTYEQLVERKIQLELELKLRAKPSVTLIRDFVADKEPTPETPSE